MKKHIVASAAAVAFCVAPAIAADIPAKALTVSHYDWTGWYGGFNMGLGVGRTRGITPNNSSTGFEEVGAGFSAGVQGGYNWQLDPHWVAGLESDTGWLGVDRHAQNWSQLFSFAIESGWYGTLRGRLGYTSGPSLFYVTGGAAFVDVKNRYDNDNVLGLHASSSKVASGWTAGWGAETMLGGNWSAKAEYLYIDAGGQSVTNTSVGFDPIARFDNRFHVFRQGLNYKFGGASSPRTLPAYNWNGFYLGANIGAGMSQVKAATPGNVGSADIGGSGFTGGLSAGYNWQFAPSWVAGVEADISWLGVDRTYPDWLNTIVFGAKTDWFGTARIRLGYSTGPALLYVTGGAAFVHVKNTYDQVIFSSFARSETATGWTVGSGIEAALGNNWTAKTEYLYVDAGNQTFLGPNTGVFPGSFDNRFHVFRAGLNYKFGG
jgi:outer membrane immunogenic protein